MVIGYQAGRIKELSELEIKSVVARDVAPSLALSIVSQKPLAYHTDKWPTSWGQLPIERASSICVKALSNQIMALGGTIRIYELLSDQAQIESFILNPNNFSNLAKKIWQSLPKTPHKLNVGLSVLGGELNFAQLRKIMQLLKAEAKNDGQSMRVVMPKDRSCELNAAAVMGNNLLTKGAEIVLVPSARPNYYHLGLTLAIHNPNRDAWLDFKIPRPDARSGMLPPKLARMMVNIGVGEEKEVTVFDPFCGNGRVLMEALLLGYPAFGRDIDMSKVESTKQNIGWLRESVKEAPWLSNMAQLPEAQIFQADARERAKIIVPKPNVIVSEPWLGPPLRHYPNFNEGGKIANSVKALIFSVIPNLIAENPRKIVLVVPKWRLAGGKELSITSDILDEIIKTGYDGSCIANVGRNDSFLTRDILLLNIK